MGQALITYEKNYWEQELLVVGLDEAGRGPMAGPCVVAGVVFPLGFYHEEINDSKKLSDQKRRDLVSLIKENALWYDIYVVDIAMIERYNIYQATKLAMEALSKKSKAKVALIDALPIQVFGVKNESIIKGDQKSISIAAASILAKTYRDDLMIEYDALYPEYGFKNHKGYATKAHKEAILKYGRCPIHRPSFRFKDEDQISLDI